MLAFTLKRTFVALLVAVTVSIISFTLLRLSGDLSQALAGPSATAADVIAVRKAYGLDQPIAVQYIDWARKAVRGDFGDSFFFKEPVWSMIATRLPVTMTLGVCALLFALINLTVDLLYALIDPRVRAGTVSASTRGGG